MRAVKFVLTILIAVWLSGARAEVAVLVHGYLGSAASWEFSGVNAALHAHGWQPAGVIIPGPSGPLLPAPNAGAKRAVYAVELPSTAPLMAQADILVAALNQVAARHGKEPINLIGHSAGGVVARMAMVRGGARGVARLITIASPHLGTERALEALDATQERGPVGLVKNVFGGRDYRVVRNSWPVLLDLSPAVPGNILYWLNAQPHPKLRYFSIVRAAPFGLGDMLVPGFSQDMNNIPQLAGQNNTYVVPAGHSLTAADGTMLAQLMR